MTNIKERIQYRKEHSVDPEEYLLDSGIIQQTDSQQELELTSAFADTLEDAVADVTSAGVDDEDIATLWDVDLNDVENQDESYPSYKIINTVRNWPTDAALQFDVAVDRVLRERQDDWEDVPPLQRYRIAQVLRTFQDECLFCGGSIVYSDEPVESCCLETRVLMLSCEECERRFMEFATDDRNMADSIQA
jgi:hypothetical protein